MQQHDSKYFVRRPPPTSPHSDPGGGVKGQSSTFSEHGHVANQFKEDHRCSNMIVYICPKTPIHHPLFPGLGGGVERSKFNFSEHGHVAYQIKWNHECSNMVANILPGDPPPPPRPWGSKGQTFSEHNHVAYQNKRNHVCSNMVANILPPAPTP